ncbi:MAG: serine O-acetyltransferase [Promethearchaeota archaeon]|nr:MAG: serine O-acetyltransferase [Candidatus Lokiarchaeota archaeon]
MKLEKEVPCLKCGKYLTVKEQSQGKSCAECILNLEFELSETDFKGINVEIQKILNFFVSDVNAAFSKDPAAQTLLEVLTAYPGIKAILLYRVSHFFWKLGMPFIPRYISEIARELTAIEIHPGAVIGTDFFIDHGSGVVIGETAKIGNNVTLYSGVVLGGTSTDPVKRHPTLGNNIVVGTGAKILGPLNIGNNVKIGANSVVIKDVPPNSVVVGVPAKIVSREGEQIGEVDLCHGDLPDPVLAMISELETRLKKLENELALSQKVKEEKS